MINRHIQPAIEQKLFKGKLVIIFGARQTGKTTLVKEMMKKFPGDSQYLNCDEPDIREMLENATSTKLKMLAGKSRILFIDEAQRVKNIGITLKLFVDQVKECQIVATGSSSFELSNLIKEPLTGRYYEFKLFPFSVAELVEYFGIVEYNRLLDDRIIYGSYPEIVINPNEKETLMTNIASAYLFKDILSFQDIRRSDLLEKLLRALALQIGSEVSVNELSQLLGADRNTISRYLALLEQSFIIFRLIAFSRNLRNEISKTNKIYFYDTGIRNSLLSNYAQLELRTDKGGLWENFIISERLKYNSNNSFHPNVFFWRTKTQKEIDFLEEQNGKLRGFEIKYSNKAKIPSFKIFLDAYPEGEINVINRENHLEYLT
jgi:predicted AAA+ superfamily ATPase